jgi:hypothetical protein
MLAAQRAAVHNATMTFARRLDHIDTIPQQDSAQNAFNKLARTFATQVSPLKDYRSKGEQKMTVQDVHVAEGGQAIVGNVSTPALGEGWPKKQENNPMLLDMQRGRNATPNRSGAVCSAARRQCGGHSVCRMHGASGGASKDNRDALKHGARSAEALALRKEVEALARLARETMAAME